MLQFWVKMNADHPFITKIDIFEKLTLIDVNFAYFMNPIIVLQCLKRIIKVDHKI